MGNYQRYIQALKEGWWIIVATILVATGVAAVISYSTAPVYGSSATFVVSSRLRTSDPGDLISSQSTLAARTAIVSTYCEILESQTVLGAAASSINVPPEIAFSFFTSCVVLPDSSVLQLQVNGPSAQLAADLANAVGSVGLEFVSDLQEVYELRRLDSAVVRPRPISPDHVTDLTIGTLIGLIGGASLALLQHGLASGLGGQLFPFLARQKEELPAKILVVDDEESISKLITTQLTKAGYYVKSARDPGSALNIAGTWRPDLILLDVMMPGMDGFQLANRIRAIDELATTPIIMLTALTSMDDKEVGFKAGADDYITKPFDGPELLMRVEAHLRRQERFVRHVRPQQAQVGVESDGRADPMRALQQANDGSPASTESVSPGVGMFLGGIVSRIFSRGTMEATPEQGVTNQEDTFLAEASSADLRFGEDRIARDDGDH